jgi:organic radical activating enzyme
MQYYEIEKDNDTALSSRILQNAVVIDETQGKVIVDKLEFPVVYGCNLQCKHCTVHTPYLHGYVTDLLTSLRLWSEKLTPKMTLVLGGEPLLRSDLPQILDSIRSFYPHTEILLITNGLLLAQATPIFWQTVVKTDTRITISAHLVNYKETCEKIDSKLEEYALQDKVRIGCENFYDSWATLWQYDENNFPVLTAKAPAPIFQDCMSKNCFTIHRNWLYRCNLMYGLKMLQEQNQWNPMIRAMDSIYGIEVQSSPQQIVDYLTSEHCYSACAYCTPNSQLETVKCSQLY